MPTSRTHSDEAIILTLKNISLIATTPAKLKTTNKESNCDQTYNLHLCDTKVQNYSEDVIDHNINVTYSRQSYTVTTATSKILNYFINENNLFNKCVTL